MLLVRAKQSVCDLFNLQEETAPDLVCTCGLWSRAHLATVPGKGQPSHCNADTSDTQQGICSGLVFA